MVLVTGCTSEDSDRGVPDDCVRTGQAYGEFPIVDSLYEAGAVTPQDAKAEAEAVGVSRSDSELLFDGPEKDFPSMSQVRQDQHLRDLVTYLVDRNTHVKEHRQLYDELCQQLVQMIEYLLPVSLN